MQKISNYAQKTNYRPSFKANVIWESLGNLGKQIVSDKASQEISMSKSIIDELALQLPENHAYEFNKISFKNLSKKLKMNLVVDGQPIAQQKIELSNLPKPNVKNLLVKIAEYLQADVENYNLFKADSDCYRNFMN